VRANGSRSSRPIYRGWEGRGEVGRGGRGRNGHGFKAIDGVYQWGETVELTKEERTGLDASISWQRGRAVVTGSSARMARSGQDALGCGHLARRGCRPWARRFGRWRAGASGAAPGRGRVGGEHRLGAGDVGQGARLR
jgi:hypothetical protein